MNTGGCGSSSCSGWVISVFSTSCSSAISSTPATGSAFFSSSSGKSALASSFNSASDISSSSITVSNPSKGIFIATASDLSGVKLTLRCAGISISSPVFTFTLFLDAISTTLNVPRFLILTVSPCSSLSFITPKSSLRNNSLTRLDVFVSSAIVSTNSGNAILLFIIHSLLFT